jgi:hypothetical protein
VVAREEHEGARLASRRAGVAHRLLALRRRVLEAERVALAAAEAETRELQRFCDEVRSALRLDRNLFLGRARATDLAAGAHVVDAATSGREMLSSTGGGPAR